MVSSTKHDLFVDQDYQRLKDIGIFSVREGLRWHLIETSPGRYDFSSALRIMEAADRQGIQIVWDLLHFGWPEHLDVFDKTWVESFGDFAAAFGGVLSAAKQERTLVAPVNEISFLSWGGGDTAYLNPFATGRGQELKRQLVRGAIRASEVLKAEVRGVCLVSPEPVIHIVGDPNRPDDVLEAKQYRLSMFESWDMLTGRVQPELGGKESYLDVIGINYYDRNQWWNHGKTIWRNEPEYRPFRDILIEVHERYQRPMFVSETGTEGADRPGWLAYIADEVRAAIDSGASLLGICLYPILNHAGWDDDRHCLNGLWDYPGPNGKREIYQPLADELERHQDLGRKTYDQSFNLPRTTRFDLSFPSALEFCFPASAAFDEQICPG